ncbi:hypothetical protein [Paenibacillus polymyxa]|uniref:hypothetical protein n=1 Tax=Paenibacillus polymyxa TaxID=1406 RepID=UPI00021BBB57|nr:hypothetical protein [Paenibacillus polymyxa]MDN4106644.1 hypothetical protein [Paenibacillus polymyxa]CCC86257.1 hypothetical protein PPM_p0107 [Paenibacillus polymyxa M1]
MTKYLSIPFASVIAVLLLFYFPLQSTYEQQDQMAYNLSYNAVTNFVDSVRNKGYISPMMYNDFTRELGATNNLFEIKMEHKSKRYNPIYKDPTDEATFMGTAEVYYDAVYQETILATLFPDNGVSDFDPSRKYYLKEGDFFTVTVRNTNTTKAKLLSDFLTNGSSVDPTRIDIPYGGIINNEDY